MGKKLIRNAIREYMVQHQKGRPIIRFSTAVFLVTLLLTFLVWDYYFNSRDYIDRTFASSMMLISGLLFSAAAGFLALTLEVRSAYLQEEVDTLRAFLPICSSCKKIRDEKGYWQQVEAYIQKMSSAKLTHGICEECIRKLYPDMAASLQKRGVQS